ncbi:MAG: hypothetical protein LBU57_05505 [Dysgonamonadaceae bacterium]|nr:hypothetical protein [Dysgonamonadaceae bacterium]
MVERALNCYGGKSYFLRWGSCTISDEEPRWTPNNTDATYPRMYYNPAHNLVFSDYWLEDASYIRLKNIQLGYTIPKDILRKININRLKIYASIDNLVTITNYFGGFDPEVRETAGDNYPQVKTFAIGIQIGL